MKGILMIKKTGAVKSPAERICDRVHLAAASDKSGTAA